VFRSHRHIYAQIIDDGVGRTLCASSSRVVCGEYGGTVEHATKVGTDLAEKAKALSIAKVRFDRGRYRFHGRVRALADAARKGGLEF
jgi:large subunit ribosomal protein L18